MILAGLKTYLETGVVLTTAGSLMYAVPGNGNKPWARRDSNPHALASMSS